MDNLLIGLKNSDESVFDQVYQNYYSRIVVFVSGLTKSYDTAKDITQDLFMKLWINRADIDTSRNLNNYMYVLARNAAFNYLKKELKSESLENDYLEISESKTPENELYAKEIALLYEMTISQMPPQRQKIYRLKLTGLSNQEIAVQLSISKKTVDNQISLAMSELRQTLLSLCIVYTWMSIH